MQGRGSGRSFHWLTIGTFRATLQAMHKKILQEDPKGLKNIRLKIYDGASIIRGSYVVTRIYTIYRIVYTISRMDLYDFPY